MASHRAARETAKQQGSKSKQGQGAAAPWYETKGKIVTPVQGFAGEDVMGTPPAPARLRGDTHPVGSTPVPSHAQNPSTNALSPFGLNGSTPGKKAR